MIQKWQRAYVGAIYATHNRSPAVRKALGSCLEALGKSGIGLDVGSGDRRIHPRVLSIDLLPNPSLHLRGSAESLPLRSSSVDFVMSQEVLEHVRRPFEAVREIYRVLRVGGRFYCQVPFVIGYHPGPTDFWRFTREGVVELVTQAGFSVEEMGIAVGPGTGMYRILVEYGATLAERLHRVLYRPAKGLLALALFPLKWTDAFLSRLSQSDRIAGGYFVVARK